MLKLIAKISKFSAALLIVFKVPKLFRWSNKIIFRSVSSKILDPSAKSFFPYINDIGKYFPLLIIIVTGKELF